MDTSSGDPYLRSWTFGDGATSGGPNPSHQFSNSGTYTVSLTVTNAAGSDTAMQTITVLPAQPTALPVSVDIEPGLCPNLIGLNMKGPILVVAIAGTKDMDAARIDPATITLSREGVTATVRPTYHLILDVTRPYTGTTVVGQTIPFTIGGSLKPDHGATPMEGSDCMKVISFSDKKIG